MKIDDLGDVIAVRRLSLAEGGSGRKTVVVKLGMPRQFPDSPDYYVPFQVTGIGPEKVRHAGGVDAIQAIQSALKMLGFYLRALNDEVGGGLSWEGDETGDLGFQ